MAPKTSSYILPLVVLLVVVSAAAVAAYVNLKRKSKAKEAAAAEALAAAALSAAAAAAEAAAAEERAKKESTDVEQPEEKVEEVILGPVEDPNTAFPSMLADVGDADAELASAFTYENLQDSMLTSGRDAREAVKSRAAWSRFGERGNAEIWEEQMAAMKKEIQASGQTVEQFMESSWAPIPEQMAAYWKDAVNSEHVAEVVAEKRTARPSRAALSEAPSLTRDATQDISVADSVVALQRMSEISDARKRAKSLKLNLPAFSSAQKKDIDFWSASEDKAAASAAKVLLSL
jgi:type II secretory pathway pseudopilin PulG